MNKDLALLGLFGLFGFVCLALALLQSEGSLARGHLASEFGALCLLGLEFRPRDEILSGSSRDRRVIHQTVIGG